ncbi:MAG: hypothetical protein RL710_2450, partial [Pseudomonadota bacterium]
ASTIAALQIRAIAGAMAVVCALHSQRKALFDVSRTSATKH